MKMKRDQMVDLRVKQYQLKHSFDNVSKVGPSKTAPKTTRKKTNVI